MIVDCDSCVMREIACSDCFVSFLLDRPAEGAGLELDDEAAGALRVLADAALVPPLRLATAPAAEEGPTVRPVPPVPTERESRRRAM